MNRRCASEIQWQLIPKLRCSLNPAFAQIPWLALIEVMAFSTVGIDLRPSSMYRCFCAKVVFSIIRGSLESKVGAPWWAACTKEMDYHPILDYFFSWVTILPPEKAKQVSVFFGYIGLEEHTLDVRKATSSWRNLQRTPRRSFVISGPCDRWSLRLTPSNWAEQSNTTRIWLIWMINGSMRDIVYLAVSDVQAVRRDSLGVVSNDIFYKCSVISEILGIPLESGCKLVPSLHLKMTIEREWDLVWLQGK